MEITTFINILLQVLLVQLLSLTDFTNGLLGCRGVEKEKPLKYIWGDAMVDSPDCVGPQGQRYPHHEVAKIGPSQPKNSRRGKSLFSDTQDPLVTRTELLNAYSLGREGVLGGHKRDKRDAEGSTGGEC